MSKNGKKTSMKKSFMFFGLLYALTTVMYIGFHISARQRGIRECEEPNTAVFLHVGMVNPRGSRSTVLSMVKAFRNTLFCRAYFSTADGHDDQVVHDSLTGAGFAFKQNEPFYEALTKAGLLVYEYPTLHNLWTYCGENPEMNVMYLQALGSHKAWSLRRQMTRRVLQHQVVWAGRRECASLRGKWHCGPNLNTEHCWQHYSGNMWRASCEHVNTLRAPASGLNASNFASFMAMGPNHGDSDACPPYGPIGRYWAEAWIVNGHPIKNTVVPFAVKGFGGAPILLRWIHTRHFMHNQNILYFLDSIARRWGVVW